MAGASAEGLFEAIRTGDLARVAMLLDADPSLVRARSPRDETPVLFACYHRRPAMVGLLRCLLYTSDAADEL